MGLSQQHIDTLATYSCQSPFSVFFYATRRRQPANKMQFLNTFTTLKQNGLLRSGVF